MDKKRLLELFDQLYSEIEQQSGLMPEGIEPILGSIIQILLELAELD